MPTSAAAPRRLALVTPAPRPSLTREEALRRVRAARRHVDDRPVRRSVRAADRFAHLKRTYD